MTHWNKAQRALIRREAAKEIGLRALTLAIAITSPVWLIPVLLLEGWWSRGREYIAAVLDALRNAHKGDGSFPNGALAALFDPETVKPLPPGQTFTSATLEEWPTPAPDTKFRIDRETLKEDRATETVDMARVIHTTVVIEAPGEDAPATLEEAPGEVESEPEIPEETPVVEEMPDPGDEPEPDPPVDDDEPAAVLEQPVDLFLTYRPGINRANAEAFNCGTALRCMTPANEVLIARYNARYAIGYVGNDLVFEEEVDTSQLVPGQTVPVTITIPDP